MAQHATTRSLKEGEVIDGVYVVERFLAGGAMGQVYVARDRRLDRRVAIKLIHTDLARERDALARFQREARALSKVVHPNVVAIHGFGRHQRGWFIAMEFVDGESIEGLLEADKRLDLKDAVMVVRQVANGLAEAHALGIVHRDIKPANIILRRLASGILLAKVVDFGLARGFAANQMMPNITMSRGVAGTPAYMSPEQARGETAVEGASDQYSLAVVFYEMVTGDVPFPRENVTQILAAQIMEEPPPLGPNAEQARHPQLLERELVRALAKAPEDRHPTILAFAEAIEKAAGLASEDPIRVEHGEGVACPSCDFLSSHGGCYCSECGGAIPAEACSACGALREGERYFCLECGTSLLPGARATRAQGPRSTVVTAPTAQLSAIEAVTAVVLSARLFAPADGASMDAEFADHFAAVVGRERGRPLAIVGREAIAVFGLGGMREHEVEAAIDAALALEGVLSTADTAVGVGVDVGSVFTRGVGVAGGTAFAGGTGAERARRALSAMDAGEGGVVIGPAAYREVRGLYETSKLGEDLRRVRSRRRVQIRPALTSRATHASTLTQLLPAREYEVSVLFRGARMARRLGGLVCVPILGPSGSGKSRLLAEFGQRIDEDPETWHWDAARCSPSSLSVAFEPFTEILRTRLRLDETKGPAEATTRIAKMPFLTDSSMPFPDVEGKVGALGRLLGVTPGRLSLRPATGSEQRQAFGVYVTYLQDAVKKAPVVMVIEDLHFATEPTLQMLAHILERCAEIPLLVVLTIRDDRADEVLKALRLPATRTHAIRLGPLQREATERLLAQLLPGTTLPNGLVSAIHEFSGGLPLHVETAVEALVDEGVIGMGDTGRWQLVAERARHTLVLDSFNDVVLRRIGRLAPADRRLLYAVAIAGESAPRHMLRHMLAREVSSRDLDLLHAAGYLVEARTRRFHGDTEWTFQKPRVREVVLHHVPEATARELHQRAAEWLRDWKGARPSGFEAMLAEHSLKAGADADAACYLLDVARNATAAFATREAFEAYRKAAEAAERWYEDEALSAEEREAAFKVYFAAHIGAAECGLRIGVNDDALASASKALAICKSSGRRDTVEHARALCARGEVLEALDRRADALRAFSRSSRIRGQGKGAEGIAIYAMGCTARMLLKSGQLKDSRMVADLALAAGQEVEADDEVHRGLGAVHGTLGELEAREGRLERAAEAFAKSRTHLARAGEPVAASMAGRRADVIRLIRGAARDHANLDLERAAEQLRNAVSVAREIDFALGVALGEASLGGVLLAQGRKQKAIARLHAGQKLMREHAFVELLPGTLVLMARAHLELGDLGMARELAEEASERAKDTGRSPDREAAAALLERIEGADSAQTMPEVP